MMRTDRAAAVGAGRRGARARSARACATSAAYPELWVPLVMMAVVGTLAFNFQVVLPLLVTRTFDGSKVAFTILFSVISLGSLVGALWTARRRTIGVTDVVKASLAFGLDDAGPRRGPEPGVGVPDRRWSGRGQHRLPHRLDRHRPDRGRPGDAGPGAGPAGHGLPRQHAHRRPDRRLLSPTRSGPRWAIAMGGLAGVGAAAWGAMKLRDGRRRTRPSDRGARGPGARRRHEPDCATMVVMSLSMPPEWAPHERCVVAWPCRADMWRGPAGRGQGDARRGGRTPSARSSR